jgi:DnaK suppressor protein
MEAIQTDRVRAQLQDLRTDLRRQLVELGANPDSDTMEGEGFDAGFADSAHSTAERGKVLALAEHLRDQLRDVEHALGKLDDGTYGTCESCGNPIAPERLEALPYTRLCVTCKQRAG